MPFLFELIKQAVISVTPTGWIEQFQLPQSRDSASSVYTTASESSGSYKTPAESVNTQKTIETTPNSDASQSSRNTINFPPHSGHIEQRPAELVPEMAFVPRIVPVVQGPFGEVVVPNGPIFQLTEKESLGRFVVSPRSAPLTWDNLIKLQTQLAQNPTSLPSLMGGSLGMLGNVREIMPGQMWRDVDPWPVDTFVSDVNLMRLQLWRILVAESNHLLPIASSAFENTNVLERLLSLHFITPALYESTHTWAMEINIGPLNGFNYRHYVTHARDLYRIQRKSSIRDVD